MGHRELKRVALDFEWPLKKVWSGYVNPYPGPIRCKVCNGTGYNAATKQISDDFYAFDDRRRRWCDQITQDEVQALIDKNRLMDFTHVFVSGEGWKRREDNFVPTAEQVNKWNQRSFPGHDAINRWILIETRAKRLGVFGNCEVCQGEGELPYPDEGIREKYNAWKEFEPPKGDGYQLWETVSEGSPVSPVFKTPEELADWCADNATIFASEKTSRSKWMEMFIGKNDLGAGSMLIFQDGYVGSLANAPVKREE